jgi:tRNA threonylcarbamoyladenosine biosynthesis protein TsaB
MSVRLMPVIDEALKNTNISLNELDKIFVCHGPGSFTGIRIGLTFAKTLAWSLKIPVIPISTLELLASSSKSIALINARRGYVFAGGYDDNLDNFYKDRYILLEDLPKDIPLVSLDKFDISVSKPDINILKVIKKHENEKGINPHSLNPVYLKKTEAEEKLGA